MSKPSKGKMNLEKTALTFWKMQKQWNGKNDSGSCYTVTQTNNFLRTIIQDSRLPKTFKQASARFQRDVVNCKRTKKKATAGKNQSTIVALKQ